MARLIGVDLPAAKRIEAALTYIYGIGFATSRKILEDANVDPNVRVKNLSEGQLRAIRESIERLGMPVEGDLRKQVSQNIKRLMDINSYRGLRHRKGLPVRGQRTRTNSRTRKGKRKTVAGKKRAIAKK